MSRWVSVLLSVAFAVFGWGVAGYGFLIGGMACDEDCSEQGPVWTEYRDATEWSYYPLLGVAFAVCATAVAVVLAVRRPQPTRAFTWLSGCALAAALLWYRVDVWSPSASDDLAVWLVGGLLFGVAAALIPEPGASITRGERAWKIASFAIAVLAVMVVTVVGVRGTSGERIPPISIDDVLDAASASFTINPEPYDLSVFDAHRPPAQAIVGLRPVGAASFELGGPRWGVTFVFAHDDQRITYALIGGTYGLRSEAIRTETVAAAGERRTLRWINDGLMTFEHQHLPVIIRATPVTPETARIMRQLAIAS